MTRQRTREQMAADRAKAKRWAKRIAHERTPINKKRCQREMLRALFSALGPRPDGSDPLDGDSFKLEGV